MQADLPRAYPPRMGERGYPVAAPDCSDRRNVVFWTAKAIVMLGHRFLVRPHVEMHPELLERKRGGRAVFLYCGLHKSLWETTGVLPPLHLAGLPIPYVGMGDNLIKGRLFESLSRKIGAFFVQRPANRRQMLESARKLRGDVLSFIAHGRDVMIFPEGTRKNIPAHERYGEFFPAAFDALLEYTRNRDAICANNPGLEPYDPYVVPFNVDYTRVREASEMVAEGTAKPRTLHVFDSLSMIRSIGDTYLSYGKPMRVADHLDTNRRGLASYARERCLELVKILPVNVACRAVLEAGAAPEVAPTAFEDAVKRVVDRLRPYADRFRGFNPSAPHTEVARRAAQALAQFREYFPDNVRILRLYAAYIAHYLDPASVLAG